MDERKVLTFKENACRPDENAKVPFYIKHDNFIWSSVAVFLLVMTFIGGSKGMVFGLHLMLLPALILLYKQITFNNMKIEEVPAEIEFLSDKLILTRPRIYTTPNVSREEKYVFKYNELKELKYNKVKNELIINGNASIMYTPFKKDKLAKKPDFKHDAPCLFAMYPVIQDVRSFKKYFCANCPYPVDYTDTESVNSAANMEKRMREIEERIAG